MIALSGIMDWREEEEAMRAGKGQEQHDVDAFFLDGGRSPQKSCLKYPVTRSVLWCGESPQKLLCQGRRVHTNLDDVEADRSPRKVG